MEEELCLLALRCLDADGACEVTLNAGDALHLALGREAFVKTFVAEIADLFPPRCEAFGPAVNPAFFRAGILRRKAGANADHGFERDGLGDHVIGVAPGLTPDIRGGF